MISGCLLGHSKCHEVTNQAGILVGEKVTCLSIIKTKSFERVDHWLIFIFAHNLVRAVR